MCHELLVDIRRNMQHAAIMLGQHHHVKLDVRHDAGRRKQTHIPRKKTVERKLLALVGERIDP
ncbi:hypothetical protein SDC9_182536 [bioreactor metagenome]|uniref:Uncharacterized protein n=1 Tax=bioreactor metagenome TaxID=1076179 RepID=A0A645H9J7_9ZZZZ